MARKEENIYKRKDGRWEGRYKVGTAKYRSVYFTAMDKSLVRSILEYTADEWQKLKCVKLIKNSL